VAVSTVRIALANIPRASSPDESVALAIGAIEEAGHANADIICFPEAYVPGYRPMGGKVPPPDAIFLQRAWTRIAAAAAASNVAVILGTERVVDEGVMISTLVINPDGTRAGFQDKVQLDPGAEDDTYVPGSGRHLFTCGPLTFGIAICHEGFRYPETVRWAAQNGAQVVFHPHLHEAEPGSYQPSTFGDPANTFHEKAALCRAAENTVFFATVNCASQGSGTTSAIVDPDGSVVAWQPYGKPGLLIADIDLSEATGLLASRLRS
jgi:predicted amidohydrolase